MTPRQRFLTALTGEMPDYLPLCIWNNKLPDEKTTAQLLKLEVLIVNKSSVWQVHFDGAEVVTKEEVRTDGVRFRNTIYRTDCGELKVLERWQSGSFWIEKFPFSSPDDYPALEALIASRRYLPDFERFLADDEKIPGKTIARPVTIHSPMHELIYEFMGIENFSIEFNERQGKVLRLLEILTEDWQRRIDLVAESPAKFAVIEGNTEIEIVGEERFQRFYFPNIQRASEILHERNKLVGAHLDGNNKLLAPLIAETSLDFIESFTPPPDCDLPVSDALKIWKDKTLQIHIPSSVHLQGEIGIKNYCLNLLEKISPGRRVVVGVSEDVPHQGKKTLIPLFQFLRERGKLPLKFSAKTGVIL